MLLFVKNFRKHVIIEQVKHLKKAKNISFSQGKETEMVARKNVENEKVVGKGVKRFVVIIPPQDVIIHVHRS